MSARSLSTFLSSFQTPAIGPSRLRATGSHSVSDLNAGSIALLRPAGRDGNIFCRRAGDCKDGNDSEPNVTDKLGSIARLRGGIAIELYARCMRDLVKANVHGPRLETGLTISKVVLPGSLEAIVKSQRRDGRP